MIIFLAFERFKKMKSVERSSKSRSWRCFRPECIELFHSIEDPTIISNDSQAEEIQYHKERYHFQTKDKDDAVSARATTP